jgi:hypothetical protein
MRCIFTPADDISRSRSSPRRIGQLKILGRAAFIAINPSS